MLNDIRCERGQNSINMIRSTSAKQKMRETIRRRMIDANIKIWKHAPFLVGKDVAANFFLSWTVSK